MSHDLNDKYSSVGCGCCMDAVNGIGCDLQRTLETKGHVCSPDIIINSLRKMDDIQAFLTEKIGCFLCSVSTENHKTVKAEFIVSLLHCLNLIQSLLIRNPHQFERLSGCSENGSALSQDSGKILGCEHTVFPVDQSLISIIKAINLKILNAVAQSLYNASHGRVQCLTVTTACQQADSFNHSVLHSVPSYVHILFVAVHYRNPAF